MTAATATQPQEGMTGQILLELGKISAQIAVMDERLKAVPDHENRLRLIEAALPPNLETRLGILETTKAKLLGMALTVSALASAGGTWVGILLTRR